MSLFSIGDLFSTGVSSVDNWTITDAGGGGLLPIYSVLRVEVSLDGQVVSEPIELGSFNSYNKTNAPAEVRMDIAFCGTNSELQEAHTKVKELKESVNTFSIVTPYYEFENMALQSVSYSQTATDGLGMLVCSITCVEIKESAAAYSTVSQDALQASQQSPIGEADATNPSDVSNVETGQTAPASLSSSESPIVEEEDASIAYRIAHGGM